MNRFQGESGIASAASPKTLNKAEVNLRSQEVFDELLRDPAVCAALERWRSNNLPPDETPRRPEAVKDWMCGEA
jgi:hypothetical protein